MARKVVWAHAAIDDMEAIAERGRVVPEFENKNFRELFIQNYRMIYRIEDDHVFIVALIHGRRDLRTTLQ